MFAEHSQENSNYLNLCITCSAMRPVKRDSSVGGGTRTFGAEGRVLLRETAVMTASLQSVIQEKT